MNRAKRTRIIAAILEAVQRQREYYRLLSEQGPEYVPSHPCHAINAVKNFLFPIKTYEEMMESDRLPLHTQDGRILYELDANILLVRVAASLAHDACANAINVHIGMWSSNGGNGPLDSLEQLGQGGKQSFNRLTNLIEWYRSPGTRKSPDQSFRPSDISRLLGANLIPGTTTLIYPTMVIEIGVSHETYPQLLRDAEAKHFSIMTSVRVWVGVKAFPGKRMRCAFKIRDINRGYGWDPNRGAETDYIDFAVPTQIQFIIPKAEIFFATAPANIPPTLFTLPSNFALPPQNNAGPTDDYVLPLELFRKALFKNWN